MSLYHTYRPQDFQSFIGNDSVKQSIESILQRESDWPPTWLFSGPSGCGKTTLARIVASRLDIRGNDLAELNIAKLRGIDSAREIQEQMIYKPTHGSKHRGFLLDEVHMGTPEFFNALLKTFEDTPKHVFFFLCTTEPEKLLPTVTGRCSKHKLTAFTFTQLVSLIRSVLIGESQRANTLIDVPDEVIKLIATTSDGSARAALNTLDSIIDMEPAAMLEAAKTSMHTETMVIELCEALMTKTKWREVSKILRGLGEYNPEQVKRAVLGYCNAKLLRSDNALAYEIMNEFRNVQYMNARNDITWAAYRIVKIFHVDQEEDKQDA